MTLRILPLPNRRGEVLEILRSVQGPVQAQPGCAACRIFEELGPDRTVLLVERWESEAALEAHVRSQTYRRILGAVELSARDPEIRFDVVTATEGMEKIVRLHISADSAGRSVRPANVGEETNVKNS